MANRKSSALVRGCRRYVRMVQIGDKWNTYLHVDHQSFCIVEQTTKRRAEWHGKMLAIALARLVEQMENTGWKTNVTAN